GAVPRKSSHASLRSAAHGSASFAASWRSTSSSSTGNGAGRAGAQSEANPAASSRAMIPPAPNVFMSVVPIHYPSIGRSAQLLHKNTRHDRQRLAAPEETERRRRG